MPINDNKHAANRTCTAFFLLLIIIFLTYSNTFQAGWHLDDHQNITHNNYLHIKDLSLTSLYSTFYAHPYQSDDEKRLFRPVACLTFAINWYIGEDDVFGYHFVNISIHLVAAFFLFLTVLHLYSSPALNTTDHARAYFVALITALFWAINPIQTQAVTYIVQRMASLAAMFYIMGVFFYVKGRNSQSLYIRSFNFLGCFACFILAIGSKQNAVTFPAALLLVEMAFYRRIAISWSRRLWVWGSLGIGLAALLLIVGTLSAENPFAFLNSYEDRPFTMSERLMIQPRVLLFYLSQIFYPVPSRLSIEHDLVISTSLFTPWTTFPAILCISLFIIFGIYQLRKRPIICFAILFFFLNHIVESTIIPLELIFEHRNYLPSMFLFFPVSVGLRNALDHYRRHRLRMYYLMFSFIILLLIGLGSGTYIRNMAWRTEKALWEDAMAKAPKSDRPPHNLAWGYYEKIGDYEKALALYEKALQQDSIHSLIYKDISLANMAKIYYGKQEYERALMLSRSALAINPINEIARFNMILQLLKLNRVDEALENADILLKARENHPVYLDIKGLILLRKNQADDALRYFEKALAILPDHGQRLLYTGVTNRMLGKYEEASAFFKRSHSLLPNDLSPLFHLIENSLRAGDTASADKYADRLLATGSLVKIENILNKAIHRDLLVPLSHDLIGPLLARKMKEKAHKLDTRTEKSNR